MHAPSTTSSCVSTDRFSPGNSSRNPRTSAISAGTRAVAGSPRDGIGGKAKHPCAMAAPMSDAQVEALGKDVVEWYVRQNPIFATYIGIHDRDHLLPKGTYEAEIEECERVKEFLRTLEAIDRKTLSPSKRVDWGVLRNAFRLWIFQSEGIGIWKSKPTASDAVGDSLFPLFMRSFAPLAKRLGSITGRLERSPAYIEETKGRIRTPVRMWSEIALEATERLPGFLHVIEATGKENLTGPERARLEEAVAKTEEALRRHARWIKEDVIPRSKDTIGIGAAKFRKLVRLRELGLTVDEIYAIGKEYLRESKRTLARLANEIKPGDASRALICGDTEHGRPRGISGAPPPAHVRQLEPLLRAHLRRCRRNGRRMGPLLRGHDEGSRIQRRPEDEVCADDGPDLAGLPHHHRRGFAQRQDGLRRSRRLPRPRVGHGATRSGCRGEAVHVQPGIPTLVSDRQASHPGASEGREEGSCEKVLREALSRHNPVRGLPPDEVCPRDLRVQGEGTEELVESGPVTRPPDETATGGVR